MNILTWPNMQCSIKLTIVQSFNVHKSNDHLQPLFFLSKIMHVIFIYLVYLSRIHMDSLNRILSIFMSLIMECLSYVCARAWMLSFFFSDGVFSFVIIPATRLSDYEYCEQSQFCPQFLWQTTTVRRVSLVTIQFYHL